MNIIIISYSLTGNNNALATRLASELSAKHIQIREATTRTRNTIVFDVLFNRTPKIDRIIGDVSADNMIVFVGPVWMGRVATPFRAYFKHFRGTIGQYAFVSISGGASGPNPNLAAELTERLGKPPLEVIDLHIADLLSLDFKSRRSDTSSYRVTETDISSLTGTVVKGLRHAIKKMESAAV